jgi:hypothetical protein
MLQALIEPTSLLGQQIPRGVLRWYAIIRTSGGVSPGELKRDSKKARRLKAHFWSNANAANVDSFEWISDWPGTRGARSALRFSWPAGPAFAPATFADLLDRKLLGDWEDVHCVDREGLLISSVTHERMVMVRVPAGTPGAYDERLGSGEAAIPEFGTRLLERTS